MRDTADATARVRVVYTTLRPFLHHHPPSNEDVVEGDLSVCSRPKDLYLGRLPLGAVEKEADVLSALRVEALDVPHAPVKRPPSRLVRDPRSDRVPSGSRSISSDNGDGGAFPASVCLRGMEYDAMRCDVMRCDVMMHNAMQCGEKDGRAE